MLFVFGICLSHASASKFPSWRWALPNSDTSLPSLVHCIENYKNPRTLTHLPYTQRLSWNPLNKKSCNTNLIPKQVANLVFNEVQDDSLQALDRLGLATSITSYHTQWVSVLSTILLLVLPRQLWWNFYSHIKYQYLPILYFRM